MTEDTKRILVIVDLDGTEDQSVVERAAWFAELFGAQLELFSCVFDRDIDLGRFEHVWKPEPGASEQLVAQQRRRLDEIAEPLRRRGLRVDVGAVWAADRVAAVLRKVSADRPWLAVKGTEHRSFIPRTFLTSTDWELVRECPVPLLLVKARKLNTKPHVLAAVDPMHAFEKPATLDDRILDFAQEVATVAAGDLQVVHAYSMPQSVYAAPHARDLIIDEHRAAMKRLLANHALPERSAHSFEGLPHERLQQAVDDYDADFLVMGAVARHGVDRWIIGSTAARMLDRVPCDLIIIKPDRIAARSERRPADHRHASAY